MNAGKRLGNEDDELASELAREGRQTGNPASKQEPVGRSAAKLASELERAEQRQLQRRRRHHHRHGRQARNCVKLNYCAKVARPPLANWLRAFDCVGLLVGGGGGGGAKMHAHQAITG